MQSILTELVRLIRKGGIYNSAEKFFVFLTGPGYNRDDPTLPRLPVRQGEAYVGHKTKQADETIEKFGVS